MSVRMNVRNFLLLATLPELQEELRMSLNRGDNERAAAVRELIAEETYSQLEKAVSPLLLHYRTDLTTHDKAGIANHPGVPFLHWACDSNTHIVFLIPASEYPAKGERIKYLFGTADRQHLLNEVSSMAEYHMRPTNNPERYTIHYFDGRSLRQVCASFALGVANDYKADIRRQWNKEARLHEEDRMLLAELSA